MSRIDKNIEVNDQDYEEHNLSKPTKLVYELMKKYHGNEKVKATIVGSFADMAKGILQEIRQGAQFTDFDEFRDRIFIEQIKKRGYNVDVEKYILIQIDYRDKYVNPDVLLKSETKERDYRVIRSKLLIFDENFLVNLEADVIREINRAPKDPYILFEDIDHKVRLDSFMSVLLPKLGRQVSVERLESNLSFYQDLYTHLLYDVKKSNYFGEISYNRYLNRLADALESKAKELHLKVLKKLNQELKPLRQYRTLNLNLEKYKDIMELRDKDRIAFCDTVESLRCLNRTKRIK